MSTAASEEYLARISAEANAAAMKTTESHDKELDPLDPLSYPDLTIISVVFSSLSGPLLAIT